MRHYTSRMAGSMRQRDPAKSNVWELKVSLGRDPETGQPRSVTRTFKGSKRAASEALAKFFTEVRSGPALVTGSDTVDELLETYIADREAGGLSPATLATYRRAARTVAGTPLGRKKLAKVTPLDVDGIYRHLRERGLSEHTLRQLHKFLSAAFRQGVRWRQMTYNPASDARAPRAPRKRIDAPSSGDLLEIIEHFETFDPDLAAAVLLACLTGLRRGALHGLQWGDVGADRLVLRRSLVRVDRDVFERPPKMRVVGEEEVLPIGPAAVEVLARMRSTQDARRIDAGLGRVGKHGWVISQEGLGEEPRRPDSMAGKMWRACEQLGIDPKISPHDLRSFNATTKIAAGVPAPVVQSSLHHGDLQTTLGYVHTTDDEVRSAEAHVAAALG